MKCIEIVCSEIEPSIAEADRHHVYDGSLYCPVMLMHSIIMGWELADKYEIDMKVLKYCTTRLEWPDGGSVISVLNAIYLSLQGCCAR